MVALLYKKILDNNNQELRHNVKGIKLPYYRQVTNLRIVSEQAVSNFKSKKYTSLYRFDSNLKNHNALEIELNDKIEVDGKKGLVSYIEYSPSLTGQYNKVIFVGLV